MSPLSALADVITERRRQIEVEDWTPGHDDEHKNGELARAACCYAYEATRTDYQRELDNQVTPPLWPWDNEWWKPKDRRRDLVRAAALLLAEIERLDRASQADTEAKP
jgi:hypothetical protein